MTNTVTPETGRRLAAAGFPQPTPAPGQWWSDNESLVFIFKAWIDEGHNYFIVAQTVAGGRPIIDDYFDALDFRGLVYLPTVGDILKELPEVVIQFAQFSKMGYSEKDAWIAQKLILLDNDYFEIEDWGEHETNPAEAAALAYLSIHEKK